MKRGRIAVTHEFILGCPDGYALLLQEMQSMRILRTDRARGVTTFECTCQFFEDLPEGTAAVPLYKIHFETLMESGFSVTRISHAEKLPETLLERAQALISDRILAYMDEKLPADADELRKMLGLESRMAKLPRAQD